jgi:hypothetical protein
MEAITFTFGVVLRLMLPVALLFFASHWLRAWDVRRVH